MKNEEAKLILQAYRPGGVVADSLLASDRRGFGDYGDTCGALA